MGDPVKLMCRICESEYFLHPASEKPVKDADLCPTCETFQYGMRGVFDEPAPNDKVTLGLLIVGLSALCVVLLIGWAVWSSLR